MRRADFGSVVCACSGIGEDVRLEDGSVDEAPDTGVDVTRASEESGEGLRRDRGVE